MVAGPEIARLVGEFEDMAGLRNSNQSGRHHEQEKHVQVEFGKQVHGLLDEMLDLGNPFEEDSGDLYNLESKVVMNGSSVESVRKVVSVGK